MKILKAFFIGSLAMITACTNPKEKKVGDLKRETIAIHDEVMPRMGELTELGSALKDKKEALKVDTSDSIITQIGLIMEQIKELEDAHEGMMQWMADYEPRYEDQHPIDSAVLYYQKQKEYIEKVKVDMEKSIENAGKSIDE